MKFLIHATLIAFLGISTSVRAQESGSPLEAFRWKNRIFVYNLRLNDLDKVEKILIGKRRELQERDAMIVFPEPYSFSKTLQARVETLVLSRAKLNAITGSNQFVLLGKDGTSKMQVKKIPPVEEVFSEIDSMPMRQREQQESYTGW